MNFKSDGTLHIQPMSHLTFSASLFLHNYGPKTRHGASLAVSVKSAAPVAPLGAEARTGDLSGLAVNPTFQRHLVLNLDVSGSMDTSIGDVQIALMALKGLLGSAFGTTVLVSVVTFSSVAAVRFTHCRRRPTTPELPMPEFDAMVSQLSAGGETNLSGGLECCYALVAEVNEVNGRQLPTWLVTMSDGDANVGPYRTADRFAESVARFKSQFAATTITLGYGTAHRPDVLSVLGNYTHISTPEQITGTVALCALETLRAVALSLSVTLPTEAPVDGAIVAASTGKTIYGKMTGEVVTTEMPFHFGFMPYGETSTTRAVGFVGREVVCTGFDLEGNRFELRTPIVDGGETATLEYAVEYFRGSHGRMIASLCKLKCQSSANLARKFDKLTAVLNDWPATEADLSGFPSSADLTPAAALLSIQCFKATVETLIERLRRSPHDYHQLYQAQTGAVTQRMFTAADGGASASPVGAIAEMVLEGARLAAASVSASAAVTGQSMGAYDGGAASPIGPPPDWNPWTGLGGGLGPRALGAVPRPHGGFSPDPSGLGGQALGPAPQAWIPGGLGTQVWVPRGWSGSPAAPEVEETMEVE